MDAQYLEELLNKYKDLNTAEGMKNDGMGDSLPMRSELPPDTAGGTPDSMGDSVKSRSELGTTSPAGMGDSLKARAELLPQIDDVPQLEEDKRSVKPVERKPAATPAPVAPPQNKNAVLSHDTSGDLLNAQKASRENTLTANLLNASQGFNEALNRTKFDRTVPNALEKQANMPVEQYNERQKGAKADMDILQQMYKNASAETLRDTTSPVSVMTRKLLGDLLKTPIADSMSAYDIQSATAIDKLIGSKLHADSIKEAAASRAQAHKDSEEDRKLQRGIVNSGKLQTDFNKDKTVTNANEGLAAASNAEGLLLSNTPISDEAVKRQLARLSGEVGVLTDQDAKAFSGGKSAKDRFEQGVKQLIDGKLTDTNREHMKEVIRVFREKRNQAIADRADHYAKQGAKRLGIDENDAFQMLLPGTERGAAKQTIPGAGGPKLVRIDLGDGQSPVTGPAENVDAILKKYPNAKVLQ